MPPLHAATAANFRIGSTNFGEFFDGRFDDVAIFNRALTDAERAAIRNGDFSAFTGAIPEPATGLLALLGVGLVALRRRRAA